MKAILLVAALAALCMQYPAPARAARVDCSLSCKAIGKTNGRDCRQWKKGSVCYVRYRKTSARARSNSVICAAATTTGSSDTSATAGNSLLLQPFVNGLGGSGSGNTTNGTTSTNNTATNSQTITGATGVIGGAFFGSSTTGGTDIFGNIPGIPGIGDITTSGTSGTSGINTTSNLTTTTVTGGTSTSTQAGGTQGTGTFGTTTTATGTGVFSVVSNLPFAVSNGLSSQNVVIAPTGAVINSCATTADCLATGETGARVCTGSASAPTAPSGVLCIYPTVVINAFNISASGSQGGTNFFRVSWNSTNTGATEFAGVWAFSR